MAIEFRCSQCNQLLHVPDESVGKNARCPKCQALMTVPAASQPMVPPAGAVTSFSPPTLPSSPPVPTPLRPAPIAQPPASSPFGGSPFATQPLGGAGGAPPPAGPANPFASGGLPPPPKPVGNPFGDAGASPASLNPYASPSGGYAYSPTTFAAPGGPITNVVVPLDPIMSHAWRVWQANLGLLVGVTLIVIVISYAIAIPQAVIQTALEHNNQHEGAIAVVIVGNILNQLLQLFLGIGQAQIALKLARGIPANFAELFGGGPRFLPVLGGGLIALIVFYAGILACIVPGILLALWFWPFYYLLIEDKASITGSFSLASHVTQGNRGTTFILALCSMGIVIVGFLALCIGVIFAMPLVSVMWATAYLMMSGQLPTQPQYVRY